MALIPIGMPRLVSPPESFQPMVQKDPVTEAATQTWLAYSLVQVVNASGVSTLQVCASAATAIYGMSPDAAIGSTSSAVAQQPPQALFGLRHYPFDLRDVIIEINATNGSASGANIGATGVTFAGGGTGGVALGPGQQYGLLNMTSGTYNKYQTLDVTNTTQKVFEIVKLPATCYGGTLPQTVSDNNPRVWVKIIPTVLQG